MNLAEGIEALKAKARALFEDEDQDKEYTPTPIAEPSVAQNYVRFSDLLPYVGYDSDNELFYQEGAEANKIESVGFAVELIPQTGASKEMADLLAGIFAYTPALATIQWILAATPQVDSFLDEYIDQRIKPEDCKTQSEKELAELYQELAHRRADFYRSAAISPAIPSMPFLLRRFRVVMAVNVPAKSEKDDKAIAQAIEIREVIMQILKTYHQFSHSWTVEDHINWCAMMTNPQRSMVQTSSPRINYDDGRAIKYQIVDPNTVIRVTESGLRFGLPQQGNEMEATVMSVRSYPKAQTLNAMGALIGDAMQSSLGYSCPFVVSLTVQVQDFERQRAVTQMKNARATQRAESQMAKFMPELADVKHDWNLAQAAFDDGSGTIKMIHQIVLFSPPSESARAVQSAQAVWRSMNFEIIEDTFMQLQGYMTTLPLCTTHVFMEDVKKAQRLTTKTAYNAVSTAPILGEWWGAGKPVMPLWGRRGQAMSLDIFSNTAGNYNACCVGTSGSGKSVTLNDLALSVVSTGGRVWVIDIGRSYEKICNLVNGQYIEFGQDSGICINPFSLVDPDNFDEDIEMLVPLFAQMISPNEPLDNYLKSQLTQHVQSVWYETGRFSTVDDLAHSLINNCESGGANPLAKEAGYQERVRAMSAEERAKICDPRVRDMGVQLFPYTSDGPYGRYFSGEANIKFDAQYIVLELEELSAKKELQAVVMFLLMYLITREMYLTRHQRKVCIIDEAWSVLRGGASGDFIESGYRRARKYNGAFITGTQGIADYFQSPAATAAINNADWILMLRQKPESILALEKSERIMIDDAMRSQLMSIKTQAGAYSEIFVHGGQMGYGVGRLMLDPFSLLLYSSKAEDYEAIMHYRRSGMTITQAVNKVLQDREATKKASVLIRRG